MVKSKTVEKIVSYESVGDELKKQLKIIQEKMGCEVMNVFPIKINSCFKKNDDAFIIIYNDGCFKKCNNHQQKGIYMENEFEKFVESVKAKFDEIIDCYNNNDFIEITGKIGGDVITNRIYKSGKITER